MPLGGVVVNLFIFKMDAANRKRKRDFQDVGQTDLLDLSSTTENCGLSAVFNTRKRRKSVGVAEYKAITKVFISNWTGAFLAYVFATNVKFQTC